MLAFADPEIIKLISDHFVPVVGDDWYQRRRNDAEGRFFRSVSDQAGRGSSDANGGSTRQAIYCFTAAGRLLAWKNAGQLPDEMRKTFRTALQKWRSLPEEQRRPGAVTIEELKADPRYERTPPPGVLIVNTFTRALEHGPKGWRPSPPEINGACPAPQRDHLWITESEWRGWIPTDAKVGQRMPLGEAVTQRILRFHLVDSTLGEPRAWEPAELRSGELELHVTRVTTSRVSFRLEGRARLASSADFAKADRALDANLLGQVEYDRDRKAFDRFDIVALGDYREKGKDTRTLGVAFELARGDLAADRVPPQGARWLPGYLLADR